MPGLQVHNLIGAAVKTNNGLRGDGVRSLAAVGGFKRLEESVSATSLKTVLQYV